VDEEARAMNVITETDRGRGLREGQVVYSADGQELGKIVALGEDTFLIEKGRFFRQDHVAHFEQIAGTREDGAVVLSLNAADLPAEIMGTELPAKGP
jgi:hypothetical protein